MVVIVGETRSTAQSEVSLKTVRIFIMNIFFVESVEIRQCVLSGGEDSEIIPSPF